MVIDKATQVSASQALSGTSLVASTDTIRTGDGTTNNQWGIGDRLAANVVMGADVGGTVNPSLLITVQTATDAAFTTPVNVGSLGPIPTIDLKKGANFKVPISGKLLGHLRVAYTQAGTSPTNTVTAWIGKD